ncbi:MAG: hypothetical protein HQ582_25195 [Planctomycetes bacterium]|nr:hypothetical protein [Planctomycetota bacterium]
MGNQEETKEERLARLQQELANLKAALPEHCHGSEGYISDHRASPEHLEKIELLEEEIQGLKAELKG